jgi:hypothetical protein
MGLNVKYWIDKKKQKLPCLPYGKRSGYDFDDICEVKNNPGKELQAIAGGK